MLNIFNRSYNLFYKAQETYPSVDRAAPGNVNGMRNNTVQALQTADRNGAIQPKECKT